MSGMTMTQGSIAADLDGYESAMWCTSSYLIMTASVAPVVGRLATIFSPAAMLLISAGFFAVGALVASQARSFAVFLVGRVLAGVGGGGIMTLAMIMVISLVPKQRRGLWIGLSNAVGLPITLFVLLLPGIICVDWVSMMSRRALRSGCRQGR
jgi:MFS family permease